MLKSFFLQELKRSVTNRFFYTALFLNVLLMLFGFIGFCNHGSYIYESVSYPINVFLSPYVGFNSILLFIMFTSPLAFATSYSNEYKTNFPYLVYTRLTKWKYHLIKCFLSGFSGAMAILIPSLILFFFTIVLNFQNIRVDASGDTSLTGRAFSNIALFHPVLLCSLVVLFTMISAWIFSVYGYLASLVIKRQWIAIVFPFAFLLALSTIAAKFNIEAYLSYINMIEYDFFPISELVFFLKYLAHIVLQLIVLWVLLRFKEDI